MTGPALLAELRAEATRRNLRMADVSLEAFGSEGRINSLRYAVKPHQATCNRVANWLVRSRAVPTPVIPTGADLAAEFDALALSDPSISRWKFAKALTGSDGGLQQLRGTIRPTPATIAKFRALMANPPRKQAQPTQAAPKTKKHYAGRPDAVRASIRRRAQERVDQGLSADKAPCAAIRFAQRDIELDRAEAERRADPFEIARTALQRRGRVIYAASVVGGPEGRFFVSGLGIVGRDEVIAEAARYCGERRAA